MNRKLINMAELTLRGTENCVRIREGISKKFNVREGSRQGDHLSTILFNCILVYVIRRVTWTERNFVKSTKLKIATFYLFEDEFGRKPDKKKEIQRRLMMNNSWPHALK